MKILHQLHATSSVAAHLMQQFQQIEQIAMPLLAATASARQAAHSQRRIPGQIFNRPLA
jgi:hypothetical protein